MSYTYNLIPTCGIVYTTLYTIVNRLDGDKCYNKFIWRTGGTGVKLLVGLFLILATGWLGHLYMTGQHEKELEDAERDSEEPWGI